MISVGVGSCFYTTTSIEPLGFDVGIAVEWVWIEILFTLAFQLISRQFVRCCSFRMSPLIVTFIIDTK